MHFRGKQFAHRFARPRQSRHYRADRDSERFRDFLVTHLLHIAQQDHLAEGYRQPFEGILDGLLVRSRQQQRFRCSGRYRQRRSVVFEVERFRHLHTQPGARR